MYRLKLIEAICSQKYRQVSENTCGLYSLKLVMNLNGEPDNVFLYFREEDHDFQQPVNALQIVEYLESEDICYEAYSITSDSFFKEFKSISIVEGIVENHFVTVLKVTKEHIYYFDTEYGILKRKKIDLGKTYNVVEIENKGKKSKYKSLLDIKVREYMVTVVLSVITTIFAVIVSFALWIGGDVVEAENLTMLFQVFGFFAVLVLLRNVAEYIKQKYLEKLIYRSTLKNNDKIQKLDLQKLRVNFPNEVILHRLERLRNITEMNYRLKLNIFYTSLSIVILLLACNYINGLLFWNVVISIMIIIISMINVIYKYVKIQKKFHYNEQTLKVKVVNDEFTKIVENSYKMEITHGINTLQIEFDTLNRLTISVIALLMTLLGFVLVYLNEIPLGNLVTYLSLSGMALTNVDVLSKSILEYIEFGYTRNMIIEMLEGEYED